MFDAKQVTTIRPLQWWKTRSRCGPDDRLAVGDARAVGVGGVAAQQQQPLAAHLGQPRHVGRRAADRRLVELVVAGEEHGPERAGERDAAGVRDRVREVDALERERAGLHRSPIGSTSRLTSRSLCSSSLERAIATVSWPP